MQFGEIKIDPKGYKLRTATVGELTVHLLKSPKAHPSADFLPSSVTDANNKVLWEFDRSYVGCLAFLRQLRTEPLIVYTDKQSGAVVDIIPVADLPHARKLADGSYDWPRSLKERIKLKLGVAELMEREVRLSPIEAALQKKVEAENRAAAEALSLKFNGDKKAAHEERMGQREQRRRKLQQRRPITVYTLAGMPVRGIPAVGDEWQLLSNVHCVAVESYIDGKALGPTEAFYVKLEQGRRTRENTAAVQFDNPCKIQSIQKMGEILVELEGKSDVISCYTAMGLEALRRDGLNGGAVRALWPAAENGEFTLYRFAKGEHNKFTNVTPLLVEASKV